MTQEPEARPVCRCHGEPMRKNGRRANGSQVWGCAVTRAARQRERQAAPAFRAVRNARQRERYATDQAYREAANASSAARKRERLATDPAFREATNARSRERYATNPALREAHIARVIARSRERYATDPAFREAENARSAARRDDPAKRLQDYMTAVVNNAGRKLDHSRQRAQELYT